MGSGTGKENLCDGVPVRKRGVSISSAHVAYRMNPVFTVVGTFIFRIQHLGLGRSVVLMAAFLLPVTTLKKN